MLCSRALQFIQNKQPSAATSFHFYQFDRPYGALDTLRSISGLLFEKFWSLNSEISAEPLLGKLCKAIQGTFSVDSVTSFLKLLILEGFGRAYVMIDGLDEEYEPSRWREAEVVVKCLMKVGQELAGSLRLWFSTQPRPLIVDNLRNHLLLEIKGRAFIDVEIFLSDRISKLDGLYLSQDTYKALCTRAEGSFLFATLMLEMIQKKASTTREVQNLIDHASWPKSLDERYRGIILSVEKRSLAR